MYKVFINDRPIILTDSLFVESDFELQNYKNTIISEIIHKLQKGMVGGVVLFCMDLQNSWENFKSHFKVIIAAGGLVINQKKEFLFIYRGNKWDLPKGRTEKGESLNETALREVKEECGISQLRLKKFLIKTYHIFFKKNQQRLKETHWFLMDSTSQENLSPQLEEGITIATFKNIDETIEALENTYKNIQLVFKDYYQNHR